MGKQRIYSLDAVRGVSALLIVFYHVSVWQHRSLIDGGTYFTQKLGLYMVELFYLLSGVSMGYIYLEKFTSLKLSELKIFYIKRYFRIAPLYFLLCLLSIWVYSRAFNEDLLIKLLANFSLLFGVVNPSLSLVTGGWSIGVEFFFYLFFPFMVCWAQKSKTGNLFILFLLITCTIITAVKVSNYPTLPSAWSIYSYPLNHFLFFWLGVLIARIKSLNNHWGYLAVGVLLLSFSGFLVNPIKDYTVGLVTGLNRVLLSVSVFLIVLYFYLKVQFKAEWLNHWSDWLASVSFSVYLLHPFIYLFLNKYLIQHQLKLTFWQNLLIVLIATVLLGRLVYYYEKYFVKLGNKLSAGIK
ncbi:acyltransferase [Solitalea sp. MAHUQ-68]|uniref:Acyltransferase n=1 Tax=Solitalea agri TaxID=2953739 RepID=A0A9X2JDH9_9SPHI|nr:acyltransferase [Solitalea agri]MCO4294173.1 acyltransferase [Solitalea agri]